MIVSGGVTYHQLEYIQIHTDR